MTKIGGPHDHGYDCNVQSLGRSWLLPDCQYSLEGIAVFSIGQVVVLNLVIIIFHVLSSGRTE